MKCKDQHCLQPSLHCLGLSSPPQNPLNLLLGKISNIHKINNSVINRSPLFSQAWAREVFFGAWRVGVSVEPFVVIGLAGPVLSTGFWVKRDSYVLRKRNVCVSKKTMMYKNVISVTFHALWFFCLKSPRSAKTESYPVFPCDSF